MAVVRRIGFTRFSRWGDNLGRLDVQAAKHVEGLDGTDELAVTCSDDVNKGDYIVWVDWQGVAHEHVVDEPTRTHDDKGTLSTTFTAVNSIAETWDDWTDDIRPSGSASAALTRVLHGTRWTVGTCDVAASASCVLYHQSVRESIAQVADTWGGELETSIAHDGASVTARSVGIRNLRGNQKSPKRFTWTKDVKSISRTVASENPKTRIYGYGKGVETETGGFGRRLTFESINGGKPYVEDAAATSLFGHLGAAGDVLPACASYVNEQCEDAAQLLKETKAYLAEVCEPRVSYTASVLDLYAFGRSWEGVAVGDRVAIIDKGFCEAGIRLSGRVSQIERDLVSADAIVTFGNLSDSMADMWQSVSQSLKGNSLRSATYDAVAGTSVNWLIQLQDALNDQFNAVGTYKLETFELGAMYSNVPLHPETGLPIRTTAGMWAVNISGRGIRLASSLASDGQWDWRTFMTGASVTADCINAGTMHADRIRAGLLTDETGANSWDLDNGTFSLSAKATVGGKTVQSIAESAATGAVGELDDELTQREIFNRLTNNGQTQGIYLSNNLLYINATYLKTGIISDAAGRNAWNLNTGALTTNYMTANNVTAKGTMETGSGTSYQAKMTGGALKFYYNSKETIELISIPSYTDGKKGGYLQCCNGATYLGLRAPNLYTAVNTEEAGTIGYTGTKPASYYDLDGSGHVGDHYRYRLKFINGICTGSVGW